MVLGGRVLDVAKDAAEHSPGDRAQREGKGMRNSTPATD